MCAMAACGDDRSDPTVVGHYTRGGANLVFSLASAAPFDVQHLLASQLGDLPSPFAHLAD
jgi:hypothetical protein